MDSLKNKDPFKQFVKSKLADYEAETPSGGWEKLEGSLIATQKTKLLYRKRAIYSAVAIAATFVGLFFIINKTIDRPQVQITENTVTKEEKQTRTSKQQQSKIETEKNTSKLFTDSSVKEKIKETASRRTFTNTHGKSEINTKAVKSSKNKQDQQSVTSSNISNEENENRSNDKSSHIDEGTKKKMIQDFIDEGNRDLLASRSSDRSIKASKYSLSLLGKSGLFASQQTNTLPATLRASVSDLYSAFTIDKMRTYSDEEVNSESETNHKQPISFGILTAFDITNKLQLETGLIYTYLSSETKNKANNFSNSEKVQFHYLGIPLNVNYTFWSINKLDVFATAGAMIEKDIYGKITYNDEKTTRPFNSEYIDQTSSKISQKNPQFSVAGGLGLKYPLFNKASFFGKIGGRYYIDANNEYKTYYNDKKLGFDVQLGIKFNF